MARSYDQLVKHMAIVKTLVEQGDTQALENLYRNVRIFTVTNICSFISLYFSFAKDPTWLEATMHQN